MAIAGLMLRYSAAADTAYQLQAINSTTNDGIDMAKWVAGVETGLAGSSFTVTLVPGDVLRFEIQGTALRGYVNGVLRSSVTDSSITTGKRAGLRGIRLGTGTAGIDNFSFGDFVAPATAARLVNGGLVS